MIVFVMYFNPRFPRGKRQRLQELEASLPTFQSTLPAGEATVNIEQDGAAWNISIHASRGGSD